MLWNSKTLWLNDYDSVVLVLSGEITMGSLLGTSCKTEGRPWWWLQCSLIPSFYRVCLWIMDPSLKAKRSGHTITVQPKETVLTAFPYWPHSSLLDFLKGEPRVLGVSPLPSMELPGREQRGYFSMYICIEAFQEGSGLSPPPASATMYPSWLITNTCKSFACTSN